jgi:hypothetical protein
MNLGQFMQAVQSRSDDFERPESIDQAIATLVGLGALPGPQGWAVRRVLGCPARKGFGFSRLRKRPVSKELSEKKRMRPTFAGERRLG